MADGDAGSSVPLVGKVREVLRSGRLVVARREVSTLLSEKTIVLALLIQLFIAAFSSFLVVGLVSLYDPGSVSSADEIEFAVTGNRSDDLFEIIESKEGIEPEEFENFSEAVESFRRREVDAVLRTRETRNGTVRVRAVAPRSSLRTTLIVVQVKEVLNEYERALRERMAETLRRDPLPLPSEAEASPYFGFSYTVLIPLLMFLPVFISGSIVSDSITEEFERGTIELLRVSPLSEREIIDGKMLAMAAVAPLQAAVWLGLLSFNGTVVYRPLELLLVVSSFSVAVVGFGSVVGLLLRDRRQSQFVYSVGVIGFFGITYLLPESSANTVAKLAIGSPTFTTHATVAVYAVGAVVSY
ncbi:MAG: ABC transporter permease, partial [Halobacteria archaeon]|nr:ABC transporter permease [Halobacteria archaeon]